VGDVGPYRLPWVSIARVSLVAEDHATALSVVSRHRPPCKSQQETVLPSSMSSSARAPAPANGLDKLDLDLISGAFGIFLLRVQALGYEIIPHHAALLLKSIDPARPPPPVPERHALPVRFDLAPDSPLLKSVHPPAGRNKRAPGPAATSFIRNGKRPRVASNNNGGDVATAEKRGPTADAGAVAQAASTLATLARVPAAPDGTGAASKKETAAGDAPAASPPPTKGRRVTGVEPVGPAAPGASESFPPPSMPAQALRPPPSLPQLGVPLADETPPLDPREPEPRNPKAPSPAVTRRRSSDGPGPGRTRRPGRGRTPAPPANPANGRLTRRRSGSSS
jgi:hypothetical protein